VDNFRGVDLGEKLVKGRAKKEKKKKPNSFLCLIDKGLQEIRDKLKDFHNLT
jgi:hypothetical protein